MYFNKFLTLYLFFSIWKGIQRFDGQGWICSPGQKSCQDLAKGRAVHRDEILGWEIQATAWSLHSKHAAFHTILSKSRLHTSHHSPDWTCQCLAKCRIKPTESYRIFLLIMILWFFFSWKIWIKFSQQIVFNFEWDTLRQENLHWIGKVC